MDAATPADNPADSRAQTPHPRGLAAGDLAIVVRLRLVLRDRAWHPLPELLASTEGFPRTAVFAALTQLVALGQFEEDATAGQGRYRFARRPFTNRPATGGL